MTTSQKTEQTLADFVASAISPVLIMGLVGSLVFFLVEILYIGQYYGRLLWFFFFFVFGAVLVSRLSMRGDLAGRATVYRLVLGLLMWLALMMYVEFPQGVWAADLAWAIHLAFIFLIWWSSHRLTLDCTLEEAKADTSGAGLLDVAGLDRKSPDQQGEVKETAGKKKRRRKREPGGLIGWWERYQRYREERRERPRTHGVWVVYFSLAALPLFGLGQALIPAGDVGRRQYAFWLMCIYVASGLGLLLCTTFLSLRRYLRQKRLQMPAAITSTWLFVGTALIVALLILGAMMPRPYPEYPLVERLISFGTSKKEASEYAMKGDQPGEGKGTAGESSGEKKPGAQSTGQGQQDQSSAAGQGQADKKSQGSKSGDQPKPSGSQEQGQQEGSAPKNGQGQKPGGTPGSTGGQKGNDGQGQPEQKQQQNQNAAGGDKQQPGANKAASPSPAPKPPADSSWFDWLKPLAAILKWVVLAAVILLVVFFLVKSLLSFLANFTHWAKNLLNWMQTWWQGLWARQRTAKTPALKASPEVRHRPFSWYRDPFLSGMAEQMSDVELIRYSFEALQAWATERKLVRPSGETPLEFVRRVGEEYPALEEDAQTLAGYYARAAYAPQLFHPDCTDDLRRFWVMLREVTERPLSAGTLSVS